VLTFEISRFKYRKGKDESSHGHSVPLSRPASFNREKQEGKRPPSRVTSFKNSIDDFNPFKVILLLLNSQAAMPLLRPVLMGVHAFRVRSLTMQNKLPPEHYITEWYHYAAAGPPICRMQEPGGGFG
jgi:hypothetical protein